MQQLFPLSREPFPPIVPRLEEEISFRDLALHRTGFHLGGEKKKVATWPLDGVDAWKVKKAIDLFLETFKF